MQKFQEVLHQYQHLYEDRNAVVFTVPSGPRFDLGEAVLEAFSADPVACLPFTRKDFVIYKLGFRFYESNRFYQRIAPCIA